MNWALQFDKTNLEEEYKATIDVPFVKEAGAVLQIFK
jgi:hypothetical protein